MDIRDKTSWPRKDQTPPSKKTVIREAVQPSCIIRVAENFPTWSRILITTSRSLIKTSWTHKLNIQTKIKKFNKKSEIKWITTATMISHNSITTQTTSWTSILPTRKKWIWEVICQIMQSTCSSMRKNHKLTSHLNTRNIINIRKSIMDIPQEVTPSKLGTIILMEGTNIRPVTTTSRARMAVDHLKIISHISRARLTPIIADQEKLPKITLIQHLNRMLRDSIDQTTKVIFKLTTMRSLKTWGRNISPRHQMHSLCPIMEVIHHPEASNTRDIALTLSHMVNRISNINLNPVKCMIIRLLVNIPVKTQMLEIKTNIPQILGQRLIHNIMPSRVVE